LTWVKFPKNEKLILVPFLIPENKSSTINIHTKVAIENYSWVADKASKKWNVKEKSWMFVCANNEWLNANKASWWTYFALLQRICMKKLFFSSSSLSHLMFIIYFYFIYFCTSSSSISISHSTLHRLRFWISYSFCVYVQEQVSQHDV